ncbi:hypothetical protein LPTSP2_33560 [Leptospira ellinghausenii]|uniref:Uncharacterized protein n=2 Tax=Leptospira ellinghausenii TaxID=1917822 RepID=A0A2P2DHE0_9LEPT|nr:hypothetical protein LPTSP2_33560 [Leptospira ellinghausenii]
MDELNFAEQNINSAQDQTQATKDAKIQLAKNEGYIRDQLKKEGFNDSDITKKLNEMGPSEINQLGNRISEANQMLKDRELLAKENYTEDEINGMTPEDIAEKAAKIRQDQVSIFDNFADAGVALGGLLMSGGAIAFGLATGNFPNTNPNAPQNPIPTLPVATEPKPTRKEEEGDSHNDLYSEKTNDSPLSDYTMDSGNDVLSQPAKDGILNILDGFIPDFSLPNLGLADNILNQIASLLAREGLGSPMAGPTEKTSLIKRILPSLRFSFTNSGNGNIPDDSLFSNRGDTHTREKNKFGEFVFTKDEVNAFNKSDKINIYGYELVKKNINGTEYFVREKNGELQALIIREDGRIMETSFQINRSIFGTSYSNGKIKILDAVGKEITSSVSGYYNPNITASEASLNLTKIDDLKKNILDGFSKDSRLTTEKKLLELRLLGADTSDLEGVLTKMRGKEIPLKGAALVEFEEYKRMREKKPLWDEPAGGYKTSTEALSSVKITKSKEESNAEYFKRLGNEIREASKTVDLSNQQKLNEHLASVAKMLGSNLDGKIGYSTGEEVNNIPGVNTVGSDGFRQIDNTDCIRWIGGVFSAAGYTGFGSFANLNTNTYLLTDDVDRMNKMISDKQAHGNGVEYLRQASNLLERTSPLIEKDVGKQKKTMVLKFLI